MALTPCPDISAADWIVTSTLPWQRLVTFGPAAFEAYARLRFLPDPAFDGQRESDVDQTGPDSDRLRTLLEVLATETRTPDDCFFCLWDGSGSIYGGSAMVSMAFAADYPAGSPTPTVAPAFPPSVLDGPKIVVPNRAYFLFHGPLADAGDWAAAEMWPGEPRQHMPDPAFVWPADRAWCVTNDVDPHWAGIGATRRVVDKLLADPRLDVVAANPDADQPAYR